MIPRRFPWGKESGEIHKNAENREHMSTPSSNLDASVISDSSVIVIPRSDGYNERQLNPVVNFAFYCRDHHQTSLPANLPRFLGEGYLKLADNFHQKGLDFGQTAGTGQNSRYQVLMVSYTFEVDLSCNSRKAPSQTCTVSRAKGHPGE